MQKIENMPRPEIILVADTVAREKNIEKEDVFEAMKLPFKRQPVPNMVLNMISGPLLTAKAALSVWLVIVKLLKKLFRLKARKKIRRMQPRFCWKMLRLMIRMPKSAILSLTNCRRLIFGRIATQTAKQVIVQKSAMPNAINSLKNIKKKSARLSTAQSKESNLAMLFWILARLKLFCAAMKLFRGKNSKTATVFARLCFRCSPRKQRARRFSLSRTCPGIYG